MSQDSHFPSRMLKMSNFSNSVSHSLVFFKGPDWDRWRPLAERNTNSKEPKLDISHLDGYNTRLLAWVDKC